MSGNDDPNATTAERAAGEAQSKDGRGSLSGLRSRLPPGVPWPLVGTAAGGGLLVLIGVLIAGVGSGHDESLAPLNARLFRVEQSLRELTARPAPGPPAVDPKAIADLTSRLAKLEAAVATARPQGADPALANRISIIEGELKGLGETVSIIGRRSDEIATTAREARQRADATATALAELAQKVARVSQGVDRGELDALASRLAAIERSEKAVEAELAKRPAGGSSDRSVRLALAASALQSAVERGGPYQAELAIARSLFAERNALDPLSPFAATGLPTAASLARELAALAPALYEAAGNASREGSFLERLQASAEKLVRVRPVKEVPGTDPSAIVARIEVKAARADLAGALDELAKLPASARTPAEAWIKKAEARQAAVDASRRVAADALAALGK